MRSCATRSRGRTGPTESSDSDCFIAPTPPLSRAAITLLPSSFHSARRCHILFPQPPPRPPMDSAPLLSPPSSSSRPSLAHARLPSPHFFSALPSLIRFYAFAFSSRPALILACSWPAVALMGAHSGTVPSADSCDCPLSALGGAGRTVDALFVCCCSRKFNDTFYISSFRIHGSARVFARSWFNRRVRQR